MSCYYVLAFFVGDTKLWHYFLHFLKCFLAGVCLQDVFRFVAFFEVFTTVDDLLTLVKHDVKAVSSSLNSVCGKVLLGTSAKLVLQTLMRHQLNLDFLEWDKEWYTTKYYKCKSSVCLSS